MSRLRYPKEILDVIKAQAVAEQPIECCGLLSGIPGRGTPEAVALHQMENVYGRFHQEDPEAFPRDPTRAWMLDPQVLSRLEKNLDAAGTPILCFYHSHTNADARLSEEDRRMALQDGRPLYPSVEYLVVAVQDDRVVAARSYLWRDGRFQGRDVRLKGE